MLQLKSYDDNEIYYNLFVRDTLEKHSPDFEKIAAQLNLSKTKENLTNLMNAINPGTGNSLLPFIVLSMFAGFREANLYDKYLPKKDHEKFTLEEERHELARLITELIASLPTRSIK